MLLDPEGRSVSVHIEDTPERLAAHPRGYSLGFVVFCLAIPLAGLLGFFVCGLIHGQEVGFIAVMLAQGPFVIAFFVALFRWMSQKMLSRGVFFVLDKRQRALSLPRLGIRLRADEICGFIEVHAWHTEGDRGEYSTEWVGEVMVLAANEDGAITRLPVLTCQRPAQVGRLAAALAEFFGAERRLLKEGWMAHRRRRAAGRAGA